MKTVYYAIGGGLGHLTRARRVLRALDLDAVIITSCAEADAVDCFVSESDDIAALIAAQCPDRLIVDTFPLGIRGELGARRAGVSPAAAGTAALHGLRRAATSME